MNSGENLGDKSIEKSEGAVQWEKLGEEMPAFSLVEVWGKSLNSDDPFIQIEAINDFEDLERTEPLTEAELSKTLQILAKNKTKESNPPLVKLAAEFLSTRLKTDYGKLESGEQELRPAESFFRDIQHQDELSAEFPALVGWPNMILKIAPDVAGSYDEQHILTKMATNRETAESRQSTDSKDFPLFQHLSGEDEKFSSLIPFAHNILLKPLVDKSIGCDLSEISLDSQVQLLKFMTEADNGRFDKLCTTLKEVEVPLRKKLLENFIAADFGEDFGDSLLEIASSERFSGEQVEAILDSFESCRGSIQGITGFYQGFDDYTGGNFVKEYARAANERLTDALAAFEQIAKTGVAKADLDWLGETEFDFESALEALRYEQKSLEIINGTLSDVTSGAEGASAEAIITAQKDKMKRTMYSLFSPEHGYCLLYTRPEGAGAYDPAFEYGNRRGIEASISLITNPVAPFAVPNPFKPHSGSQVPSTRNSRDRVSAIRLDREGRSPGQAANDPNRSPLNPVGMVSVDLAAVGDAADTPSGKIARLFSVGNKIRSEKYNRGDFELNHNTAWFEQEKYGTSEGFKNLVNYVDFTLADLCEKHPPKPGENLLARAQREKEADNAA